MGCYVNPPTEDKETWLRANGIVTTRPGAISESYLPVCLVKNPAFSAAGVAFDQKELEAFTRSDDHRPKVWYYVSRENLRKVSPLAKFEGVK